MNQQPYRIERGIPIPGKSDELFPFDGMRVGDSFTIPNKDGLSAQYVSAVISRFRKKCPQFKFCTRLIREEHCRRVWRVE